MSISLKLCVICLKNRQFSHSTTGRSNYTHEEASDQNSFSALFMCPSRALQTAGREGKNCHIDKTEIEGLHEKEPVETIPNQRMQEENPLADQK